MRAIKIISINPPVIIHQKHIYEVLQEFRPNKVKKISAQNNSIYNIINVTKLHLINYTVQRIAQTTAHIASTTDS